MLLKFRSIPLCDVSINSEIKIIKLCSDSRSDSCMKEILPDVSACAEMSDGTIIISVQQCKGQLSPKITLTTQELQIVKPFSCSISFSSSLCKTLSSPNFSLFHVFFFVISRDP